MTNGIPESEEISLSPSKDTYDAVQSDVTPISAIKELIDNSIDNWERVYHKSQDLIINIHYDFEEDTFSIEDNGGGLEEENIEKLFALGETTKSEIDTPIGAYGVGAKKAIVKIGETAELVSRYKDQDFGFGYEIDQSWLEDPDNWDVTKEAYEDIKSGWTRIRISELKLDVGEIVVDDDDESIGEESSFSSNDFFSRVKSNLSDTYEEYLKQDGTFSGNLVINFNGEQIEEPSHREWSFTPFDGFYPRTYKDITLRRHNLDGPVYLDITVGLTREGNQDTAGTDIFCQNRKVVSNNDGTVGGFGRDDLDIGELSATNSRLRVRMYFRTEGNADRLPWDTQKSGIDEYDSLMQEAYEWFEKIVYPYWQASNYGNMSQHPIKPYGPNSEQAANNGAIKKFPYKGRTRLNDRPDNEFKDVQKLNETLKSHLDLGISAPQLLAPQFRPAYKSALQSADQSTVHVGDIPLTHSDSEVRESLQKVRKLAREDLEKGVKREVSSWWKPIYDSVLKEQLGKQQELEELDQADDIEIQDVEQEGSNDQKEGSGDTQQSHLSPEETPSQSDTEDSGPEDTAEEKTTNRNDSDPADGENNNTQSPVKSSDEESTSEENREKTSETDSDKEKEQQEQAQSSQSTTQSQGPDSPTGLREVEGDNQPVVISFSPERKERLYEYLDLSSDVDREQFLQSLKQAIISEMIERD